MDQDPRPQPQQLQKPVPVRQRAFCRGIAGVHFAAVDGEYSHVVVVVWGLCICLFFVLAVLYIPFLHLCFVRLSFRLCYVI